MKIKFTIDYEVDICLEEHEMEEVDFHLLSHYAKQNLITEWREKWKNEDIYGVEVCDEDKKRYS